MCMCMFGGNKLIYCLLYAPIPMPLCHMPHFKNVVSHSFSHDSLRHILYVDGPTNTRICLMFLNFQFFFYHHPALWSNISFTQYSGFHTSKIFMNTLQNEMVVHKFSQHKKKNSEKDIHVQVEYSYLLVPVTPLVLVTCCSLLWHTCSSTLNIYCMP